MGFGSYNASASLNTTLGGKSLAENGPAADLNDVVRQLMADAKAFSDATAASLATAQIGAGFRTAPHTDFSYAAIRVRVDGPGQVQTSGTVEQRFLSEYAGIISPGTLYITAAGLDTYDGSAPVVRTASIGPLKTFGYAMTETLISEIHVQGSADPANPLILRKYDWNSGSTNIIAPNSNRVKIVRFYGHTRIEEEGVTAQALTWTADGTYGNVYNAGNTAWAATTAYTLGQYRTNGGNLYVITTAGTSAGAGGPTGTGTGIADNTAVWAYVAPALSGSVCPPAAVLWSGRQIDGRDMPLTRQASKVLVDGTDLSWCFVGGVLSVRIGTSNIETIKGQLTIIYSYDAFTTGSSYCQHRGVAALWVVGEGATLVCRGITPISTDRSSVRGALFIDAGNDADRRCLIEYPGSYGVDNNNSDSAYSGVEVYSSKGDALHYSGSSKGLEIGCKTRRAGSILTWGQFTASLNGSSIHDTGLIVRFGGDYQYNAGPTIADAGSGKSWNVGVIAGNGQETGNRYGFSTYTTVTMWLDTCHAFNEPEGEIHAEVGTTIHLFNTLGSVHNGAGTIDTYTAANS